MLFPSEPKHETTVVDAVSINDKEYFTNSTFTIILLVPQHMDVGMFAVPVYYLFKIKCSIFFVIFVKNEYNVVCRRCNYASNVSHIGKKYSIANYFFII